MTASVSLLRPSVLEPEALEAIGRAYDMVALVVPEESQSKELMESIAKRMLMQAAAGKCVTIELYLESLRWLRLHDRAAICVG
jgi:hypothetical protein